MGGTVWHGVAAMRISVSNWSTTEADVDLSVAAIERVFRADSRLIPPPRVRIRRRPVLRVAWVAGRNHRRVRPVPATRAHP